MLLSPCLSTDASVEDCLCTFQFHDANYIWTIDDFSSREVKNEIINSPTFSSLTVSSNDYMWYLSLVPCDKTSENGVDFIGLYLNLSSSSANLKVCAKYSCSILNEKQEKVWFDEFLHYAFTTQLEVDDGFGWKDFCKKDAFFRKKLLIDDKLTISCKITFFEASQKNLEAIFHRCNPVSLQHLAEDLASMRENTDSSDVVLSVQGKDYSAHKVMLTARSKVFAAMFNHDTKENKENCVQIEDMNAEVMEEMLRFIYTGNCKNVENLADGLLAASEKYDLSDLKRICGETLYRNLTAENASSTLILADTYQVIALKSKVMDFIVANSSEVVSAATWTSIMTSYPVLLKSSIVFVKNPRRNNPSNCDMLVRICSECIFWRFY